MLNGDLMDESSMERLQGDEERFVLLDVANTLELYWPQDLPKWNPRPSGKTNLEARVAVGTSNESKFTRRSERCLELVVETESPFGSISLGNRPEYNNSYSR